MLNGGAAALPAGGGTWKPISLQTSLASEALHQRDMSSRAPRTMISSFHIRNFKSYRDATLPLAPLTLLIGANASGKSNALEAVRLLTMLATGRRLSDLRSVFQSSDDEIRGNAAAFSRMPPEPIIVGCDLEDGEWNALRVEVQFERDWSAIEDEAIFGPDGRQLYGTYSEGLGGARYMEVSSVDLPEDSYFAIPVTDQQAIFTQLGSPAAFPPGSHSETIIPVVAALICTHDRCVAIATSVSRP
jgi:hypothetical protein